MNEMSAMKGTYRPLTEWERRLLQRLLSRPFPGRDELLTQLDEALASPIDGDGTAVDENGSLYLKTWSAQKAGVRVRVPAEGKAPDADGVMIHYLLFVDDEGKMNHLEVFKEDLSKVLRHAEPDELEVTIGG
jgi:hypothetical protein